VSSSTPTDLAQVRAPLHILDPHISGDTLSIRWVVVSGGHADVKDRHPVLARCCKLVYKLLERALWEALGVKREVPVGAEQAGRGSGGW
jgi:hypothetical protein